MTGDAKLLERVPFERATVRFRHYGVTFTRTLEKRVLRAMAPSSTGNAGRYRLLLGAGGQEVEPARTWAESQEPGEPILPSLAGGIVPDAPSAGGEGQLLSFDYRYLPTTRLHVNAPPQQSPWGSGTFYFPEAAGTSPLTEDALDKSFAEALERLWLSYTTEIGRSVRTAQAQGLVNILKAVVSPPRPRKHKPVLHLEQAFLSVKRFLARQGSKI
jgi:hypothetical protein